MPREANMTAARTNNRRHKVRSLPVAQWPASDRERWIDACKPTVRLHRGGSASHLKPITQSDLQRRYGYFLDFLVRHSKLDLGASAGTQMTPGNVALFLEELKVRISSVTVSRTIYKVRRITQLIAPEHDLQWLRDIENDLALVAEPKSKANRLVLAHRIVETGLTLISEAEMNMKLAPLRRATQVRNGLMLALLAYHPLRNKNFSALEIGKTLRRVKTEWWLNGT